MSNDPAFLALDDIISIHEAHLERYGGASGVRDQGLLESAIAHPQATFGGRFVHEDIFEMAAAYAFHIAKNQPFVDGNKRTGLLTAVVFLDLNGVCIDQPPDRLFQAMMDIATRTLDKDGLGNLLRNLSAAGTGI